MTPCVFKTIGRIGEKQTHLCVNCGLVVSTYCDASRVAAECSLTCPGPGTRLQALFRSVEITPLADCGCESLRVEMDLLGAAGCKAQKPRILRILEAEATRYGIADWIRVGLKVLWDGKPWTLEGFLDLAIAGEPLKDTVDTR